MYVYMYICACIQDVCMYVYRSVYVYTSPGPKYGMECIKCRCSFVRCSLSLSSLSMSLSFSGYCQQHTELFWSFAIHILVRFVYSVYRFKMLCPLTFVCFVPVRLCVYLTQFLQGLPTLLYVESFIYKYIHVHVRTDSAQQTHRHVES